MIQIDWQQIIAYLLLGGSGIGGLIWGGKTAWTKFRSLPPGITAIPAGRAADDAPPNGSVEWVKDIRKRMGSASADSVLDALTKGFTGAQAQELRISELEGKS